MKKTNKKILKKAKEVIKMRKIGLITLMAILMMSLAYAATFTAPASGGIMSGSTYYVNASSTMAEIENCTITASSALAGDTLASTFMLNNTIDGGYVNVTIDTTAMTDASDWILAGTCYNSTGDSEALTSVTAIVDNTLPTCVHSQSSKTTYLPTQTFTVAGTNAVSATLKFGSNAVKTMTELSTGDSFTYTGTKSSVIEGIYTVVATTSDGLNSTECILIDVKIDVDSTLKVAGIAAAKASAAGAKLGDVDGNNNKMVLFIIIAGVGLWYMTKKKN